jgi:hypothetical protein
MGTEEGRVESEREAVAIGKKEREGKEEGRAQFVALR